MDKQEMLCRMAEERQKLLQAMEGLTGEQMTRPETVGEWSVKDILGHIASWDEETLKAVKQLVHEGRPYIMEDLDSVDAWNARQVQKKRGLSLGEVVAEFTAVRQELLEVVEGLTEEQLTQRVQYPWPEEGPLQELIAASTFEHDGEHCRDILAWRKTLPGT